MPHNMPPLTWLRAFEASARHLSFTNAAAELNLTQAAISKQVKLLEHHLREPLFERLPRSLTLTKAGAAYLPKVHDAFERLSAGTAEVFGGRRLGILSVRAPVGYAITGSPPGCRGSSPRIPRRRCASSPPSGPMIMRARPSTSTSATGWGVGQASFLTG